MTPSLIICIYFACLTFADIYLQCSNDFTPVNYCCKKKYTLAFTVITQLIRVILLHHVEDLTGVCVIQSERSVTFQHHVWLEIFFISVFQTLGSSHRRYAFLFLIDHYYKKLGLNKSVQLPPSPMAFVLISYAFVMIMTISFHSY